MEAVRTASCASSALFLDNQVVTHLSEGKCRLIVAVALLLSAASAPQ